MTRRPSSLRWLTLAVLLPLLLLGGLAWLGTRSQVRAAWSSAREEAESAAELRAGYLAGVLFENIQSVGLFPNPPVPTVFSGRDAVLDGTETDALGKLRDDPAAGHSASGLPRRVLAGFRLYELTRAKEDAEALAALAVREEPSVLTAVVLSKIPYLDGKWSEEWAAGEVARGVSRRHPEIAGTGIWLEDRGGMWWMAEAGALLRYLDPESVARMLRSSRVPHPPWAEFRLSDNGRMIAGTVGGEVIASMPVDFSGSPRDKVFVSRSSAPVIRSLRLEVVVTRPDLIEASARQQARWTLALLASAVVVSGGALFLIHRAVERERRLNAMKSDFVASVSHELRAPVASIRLMADALVAGKIEPATAGEFHGLISREGARLSNLIENVLDFARIEQGRKRWHFETIDPAALLAETVNLMGRLAAEKSIELVPAEPPPPFEVRADPAAIQQALVNLLDNAIKFSPPGGRIEIILKAGDTQPTWSIEVADQGPGIPASEHQRIFEKFHRLGNELRRETQGTGIGLSLVKAIAEAHGGQVMVESVGQGSTFVLTFPRSPPVPDL
ncbi:HAMP domain-containing histidine kinase [Luteolibacter yonseiensis]|uniref:histidine kinase n=1 Tax=Luteolibacter yonseiensis TaxID=1144680 RepID=A0A934R7E9_9BACT|nr:HAMP domain-containing sensor histidine kinase [Luteolibacter yonseiensis]MBK1818369.1 HAMP domain-containing histidine kinase [Luteolibacter yonseiensis]